MPLSPELRKGLAELEARNPSLHAIKVEARGKRNTRRGKSARSKFYSKLMGGLVGSRGEKISENFVQQKPRKFCADWLDLTKKLILEATPEEKRKDMESKINSAWDKILD